MSILVQHAIALFIAAGAAVYIGRQWTRGLGKASGGCEGCAFASGASAAKKPAPDRSPTIPVSALTRKVRAL